MRVLVLSTAYPTRSEPSAGIFIHRQALALAALGVECHVLQPTDWAPPAALRLLHPAWRAARRRARDVHAELDGLTVHHPAAVTPRPSRFFPGDYWERVGRAVRAYVVRSRTLATADVMYAHFLCHEGFAGLVASRSLGMPLAAIARGDDVHAWPERWPDRRPKLAAVLAGADAVLACSAALARDAAAFAPARPPAISVVHNGVDCGVFRPASDAADQGRSRARFGLPQSARLLLSIGKPIAAKGWLDLLDAAALATAPADWMLVRAGAADPSLDLRAEAEARGLGRRWIDLGLVAPGSMPELYRAVDAFALASHNEGLSNSLLEAMATGLPVVATAVGGHAELIRDERDGLLVAPRRPAELALALDCVMGDRERARQLGVAARTCAQEIGSPEVNARVLLRCLEDAVRRHRRGGPGTAKQD
jgi:glycosyltransferase involved in cell wall biosynthesis